MKRIFSNLLKVTTLSSVLIVPLAFGGIYQQSCYRLSNAGTAKKFCCRWLCNHNKYYGHSRHCNTSWPGQAVWEPIPFRGKCTGATVGMCSERDTNVYEGLTKKGNIQAYLKKLGCAFPS